MKLHNAMWPGVVGKDDSSAQPTISLDRMLALTTEASVDGQKFDGVDLFLYHPHISPELSDDELRVVADRISELDLKVGSLVAPVWPGTMGGSAFGRSSKERENFLKAVRYGCRVAGVLKEHGVREYGVVRVDS